MEPFQHGGLFTKTMFSWDHCYNSFFDVNWRWNFFSFHWIWSSHVKMRAHFLNADLEQFQGGGRWKTTMFTLGTAMIPYFMFIGGGFDFCFIEFDRVVFKWERFLTSLYIFRRISNGGWEIGNRWRGMKKLGIINFKICPLDILFLICVETFVKILWYHVSKIVAFFCHTQHIDKLCQQKNQNKNWTFREGLYVPGMFPNSGRLYDVWK